MLPDNTNAISSVNCTISLKSLRATCVPAAQNRWQSTMSSQVPETCSPEGRNLAKRNRSPGVYGNLEHPHQIMFITEAGPMRSHAGNDHLRLATECWWYDFLNFCSSWLSNWLDLYRSCVCCEAASIVDGIPNIGHRFPNCMALKTFFKSSEQFWSTSNHPHYTVDLIQNKMYWQFLGPV
jgi:hypothetical protein